jgi:CubicO group peptidase (beta-lactamase class C family)
MAAIAAAGLISAGALAPAAAAQKPITNPPVQSILTWTQKEQLDRYKAIEKVYETRTIRKGDRVSPLPKAQDQINPTVVLNGRSRPLDAFMTSNRITGLLAIKDGRIILERYALGQTENDRWTSFSVAKSVTSTLVGAAVKDRWITSLNDPVTRYIPELKGSAYEGVNLREILSMTTGVRWNEDYTDPNSDVARSGASPYDGKVNPIVAYMAKLPREAEAGEKFVYKTGETDLAGIVLSRALAGKPISQYASEKLWGPLGMEQDGVWMVDQAGHERAGCCISMTLRDYGRLGQFMLNGGRIDGRDILPAGWIEEATTNRVRSGNGSYGYFWWPTQAPNYEARGVFGQGIAIYPDENLVIVMNAAMPKASDRAQSQAKTAVFEAIRAAAR